MSANFLPEQYDQCKQFNLNHNYLTDQFSDYKLLLEKIGAVVLENDFTLGREVDKFENAFAERVGAKYAIGVGSGTDALFLSLRTLNIQPGDEVITTPFTFFATIGAIVTAGAKPVFVDVAEDYNIDESKIEAAITPKTRAILPVHWSGRPCELSVIHAIAGRHGLAVVQDACHAIDAQFAGQSLSSFGDYTCYSMHPLKNLNVWGDGGIVVTNDEDICDRLRLLRNHGLTDRDTCQIFAFNSRLDTIQAVVANHLLDNKLDRITAMRKRNAMLFNEVLSSVEQVNLKPPCLNKDEVFHLYQFNCDNRDGLQAFLQSRGVDAKVHYPIPMHLQPAAEQFGYSAGDFPVAESISKQTLSLPVHEFITELDVNNMANLIKEYYQ